MEHDIKPDVISGVSADRWRVCFMWMVRTFKGARTFSQGHKFADLTKLVIPKVGLFELSEFQDFLRSNPQSPKAGRAEDAVNVTATDLDHGKSVQFRKEAFPNELRLSCCMPILFAPVKNKRCITLTGDYSWTCRLRLSENNAKRL